MKTKQFLTVLSIFFIAFIISCKKDDDNPSAVAPVADAVITGTVKTPSGQIVGSARVMAGIWSAKTDHTGKFSLDVAAGSYNLIIQTGDGDMFRTELAVTVSTAQVLAMDPAETVLKQTGALAYIPGSFDAIEDVITALGYNATMIQDSDLDNLTTLLTYNALFLNCGAGGMLDSLKYTNLHLYLEGGGSIYASDFAVDFLTGDGNWRLPSSAAPVHQHNSTVNLSAVATCISPDLGGFIADSALCTSKTGTSGMVTGATINDPDIINLLGQSTIDIEYDLSSWEVISNYDIPFTAVITDVNYGALAVESSSFGPEGGKIFYTTFHNRPQGTISTDVEDILEYFILNL